MAWEVLLVLWLGLTCPVCSIRANQLDAPDVSLRTSCTRRDVCSGCNPHFRCDHRKIDARHNELTKRKYDGGWWQMAVWRFCEIFISRLELFLIATLQAEEAVQILRGDKKPTTTAYLTANRVFVRQYQGNGRDLIGQHSWILLDC